MTRKKIAQPSAVLSVVGAVASAGAMIAILGKSLNLSEISLSLASAGLGVLAGAYSMYLAQFAKKLRLSPRVFISYSWADQGVAREVAEALRTAGARVWLGEERLKPGESIRDAVEKGIKDADAFVALLSQEARPNLLFELGMARARGVRIIPVVLAEVELPSDLQGLRYIDLRHERSRGLEELVTAAT